MTFLNRLRLKLPFMQPSDFNQVFEDLREIERFASSLLGPAVPYTPAWTSASGGAPTLGDGILTGYYRELGDIVFVNIYFEWGTTTTIGGGLQQFSLPFPSATYIPQQSLPGHFFDGGGSATDRNVISGRIPANSSIITATAVGDAKSLTIVTPQANAWATGDIVVYTGWYVTQY